MIFRVEDLEVLSGEIANIEKNCFSTPWSEEQIRASSDSTVFFIAKYDDRYVGYGGMYSVLDEGYVTNIGVLPEYRKKGIGKMILEKLLECAKAKKLTFLSLEVRPSNVPAISLYEKYGFEMVGRRPNFYQNPKEDALLLTRYLK